MQLRILPFCHARGEATQALKFPIGEKRCAQHQSPTVSSANTYDRHYHRVRLQCVEIQRMARIPLLLVGSVCWLWPLVMHASAVPTMLGETIASQYNPSKPMMQDNWSHPYWSPRTRAAERALPMIFAPNSYAVALSKGLLN